MDDTNPLAGVNPEHAQFLTAWAAKHGAVVTFTGECGFGRECVGILIGDSYLDYSHLWELWRNEPDKREELWWAPEDAYHKHDCMAVLGRGPAAVEQLYDWAKFLDKHGWTVAEQGRQPDSMIDAMFHGFSTPVLMPPVESHAVNELKRTYTADQLEVLGLPWENYLARDSEDEHRWYINWRIIFRDPADNTTWSIIKSEDKGEMDGVNWWHCYGSSRDAIIARRVEPREVTVTQWFEVKDDTAGSAT